MSKIAFLKENLQEKVYMTQPKGFESKGNSQKVSKLQRSIYGLKQASRSRNICFDETIKEYYFIKNEDEPCVYKKICGSAFIFIVLYVDNILLIGNDIWKFQYWLLEIPRWGGIIEMLTGSIWRSQFLIQNFLFIFQKEMKIKFQK